MLVNGQTGETIGAVPTYWKTIQWILIGLFVAALLLGGLALVMMMGVGAILGGL